MLGLEGVQPVGTSELVHECVLAHTRAELKSCEEPSVDWLSRRELLMDSYDVLVVGYGPVGLMASALLGQAGDKVAAFERHA